MPFLLLWILKCCKLRMARPLEQIIPSILGIIYLDRRAVPRSHQDLVGSQLLCMSLCILAV